LRDQAVDRMIIIGMILGKLTAKKDLTVLCKT